MSRVDKAFNATFCVKILSSSGKFGIDLVIFES